MTTAGASSTRLSVRRVRALPLVGNLLDFRRDRIGLIERVYAECGEAGKFRLGTRDVLILSSAEHARTVLVEQADAFEKGPVVRLFARPILGDGLISCTNEAHKRQRRMLAPSFVPRRIARYAEAMASSAEAASAAWKDGERVDLVSEMLRLSMQIVGRTLFSIDLLGEARDLSEAMSIAMHHVSERIEAPLSLPLAVPTRTNRRLRRAIKRLDETIYGMIAERRAENAADRDGILPEQDDVLSSLLEARDEEGGAPLSNVEIRDELMTLFVAGHETSAMSLAWAWYLLASNPNALAHMHAEIDRVLGDRLPTYEDLPKLSYTLCVVKEALRLYPPVHSIGREAQRDVKLGPYRLARGAIVIVSPYLMHRREEYFADALAFEPERFAKDREEKVPRYAYLPFGAGPRVCAGGQFALVEAQIVLATMARRVSFELERETDAAGIEPQMLVTLRPERGIPALVRRRDRVEA